MIAIAIAEPSPSADPGDEVPLRLAAATGMGRGYLVVHFPPTADVPPHERFAVGIDEPDGLAELQRAFVDELRELGGMTVIA